MDISLLTDAPVHNYALMRISAYHKAKGDQVFLNEPLSRLYDLSYGSWLFRHNYGTDIWGGTARDFRDGEPLWCYPEIKLSPEIENLKPDYSLYPKLDYSLGYTWRYCSRKCMFCVVPRQRNGKEHHSIWEFHDKKFKKICLLNNNTFSDPQWRETFGEIWDAGLIVRDENGYDLRLLDEEKAEALKKTKFDSQVHFAWDFIGDEKAIVKGLLLAREYRIDAMVYVLIGYDTTREEDIYRCQIIHHLGFDPYPMPYNGGDVADRAFKRFICLRYYRGESYKDIREAWENYSPPSVRGRFHSARKSGNGVSIGGFI